MLLSLGRAASVAFHSFSLGFFLTRPSSPSHFSDVQWDVRQIVLTFLGRQYSARVSALEAVETGLSLTGRALATAEFARLVVRTFLIDDSTQR